MKREIYSLELITPCFAGGAEPEKQAELRAPAIRGQLRWWFRVLGGFASLSPSAVRAQEERIFGSAAGNAGNASPLIVRVRQRCVTTVAKTAEEMEAGMNSEKGYILFPLRENERGVFDTRDKQGNAIALPKFDLEIVWRGPQPLWPDIEALIVVFGHLGALGFRSRRAMGALAFVEKQFDLNHALSRFSHRQNIVLRSLSADSASGSIKALAGWLRGWRQHGQMSQRWVRDHNSQDRNAGRFVPITDEQKNANRLQPGFRHARRDHNEGLDVQGTGAPIPDSERPFGQRGVTFRPALGLPIIQFFSSLEDNRGQRMRRSQATVNWNAAGGGRFASPILLRPYRDASGRWQGLVIFVESRVWDTAEQVSLSAKRWNPQRRQEEDHIDNRHVALDLYEAMKTDPKLERFL